MARPTLEEVRLVICRMFFREHRTLEQIADMLGCQVQTVRRVLVINGGARPSANAHGPYHKEDAS